MNRVADNFCAFLLALFACAAALAMTWLNAWFGLLIASDVDLPAQIAFAATMSVPSLGASLFWLQRYFARALVFAMVATILTALALAAALGAGDVARDNRATARADALVNDSVAEDPCASARSMLAASDAAWRAMTVKDRDRQRRIHMRCTAADLLGVEAHDLPNFFALISALVLQLVALGFLRPLPRPERRGLFARFGLLGGARIAWARFLFGDIAAERVIQRLMGQPHDPPAAAEPSPIEAEDPHVRPGGTSVSHAPAAAPGAAEAALLEVVAQTGAPAWRTRAGLRDRGPCAPFADLKPRNLPLQQPRGRDPPRPPA